MKRLVIKIGSSSLVKGKGLNLINMRMLVEQIYLLREQGVEVVLVTSGAIAAGVGKLNLKKKPMDIAKKQALAAIGQPSLIKTYEQLFDEFNMPLAQILLNHDDFGSRNRTAHLTDTFNALFSYGVVPVINENDALTVEEIKVGDNDTLSALVALIVGADSLVLITDVDGLYSGNPQTDPNAQLIKIVDNIDNVLSLAEGTNSSVGTGGMKTKLSAAYIATGAGIETRIMNVNKIQSLSTIASGENIGTLFTAGEKKRSIKQSWLLYCATKEGKIIVDNGAMAALLARKSLLICGVKAVQGSFAAGSVISVCDESGREFAVGTTYFASAEIGKISKFDKNQIVVHANNIALRG